MRLVDYNEKLRLFTLSNNSFGYAIYLNDAGYLETVYFGRAMRDYSDFACVREAGEYASPRYNIRTAREEGYRDGFKADAAPLEVSPHGTWDKRGAPIILRGARGGFETDFRYESHRIYAGLPVEEGMPHAHGAGAETLELTLRERTYNVLLRLNLSVFSDKNILIKNFALENAGGAAVKIVRAMSMQLDLPSADYDLVHFCGRWAKERDWCENPVHDGVQEVSSNLGRSSAEENPFVILKARGADETQGEAIGLNLIYSGNFKFRAFVGAYRGLHITYGMNDEDFEWTLAPGERFAAPQAVVAYSAEGLGGMSAAMHRFVRENLVTYGGSRADRPILFNSWEGRYFSFDTARILTYIDESVRIGTQLFVLDDGWFGARDDDTRGLGDWRVNLKKIDLHKVMAHCKEMGIRFGIWFEPEMVNFDSDLFRAHPEYALGMNAGRQELSLMRHQLHLDFACAAAVENIYAQMKAFLTEYPVDYIKWDYNRTVAEHLSGSLPPERQGEVYHRLVLGYYALLGRLTAEFPHTMFEGCSSGGGRFDLGTLYYCPQIWCSDESDPAQRMDIQFNTSYGYPLSAIGSHVNDSKVAPYRTKAALALFGTYGYEMNPELLTEEEVHTLAAAAELYQKYHLSVIEEGTLYRLCAPHGGNYMCMQCVSQDRSASLVIFMNKLKEGDRFRFIRLRGLDGEKRYRNDFDGQTHTGEYYMRVGLNFSREWLGEFDCRLVLLTEEVL